MSHCATDSKPLSPSLRSLTIRSRGPSRTWVTVEPAGVVRLGTVQPQPSYDCCPHTPHLHLLRAPELTGKTPVSCPDFRPPSRVPPYGKCTRAAPTPEASPDPPLDFRGRPPEVGVDCGKGEERQSLSDETLSPRRDLPPPSRDTLCQGPSSFYTPPSPPILQPPPPPPSRGSAHRRT